MAEKGHTPRSTVIAIACVVAVVVVALVAGLSTRPVPSEEPTQEGEAATAAQLVDEGGESMDGETGDSGTDATDEADSDGSALSPDDHFVPGEILVSVEGSPEDHGIVVGAELAGTKIVQVEELSDPDDETKVVKIVVEDDSKTEEALDALKQQGVEAQLNFVYRIM